MGEPSFERPSFHDIEIVGPADFSERIIEALQLIDSRAHEAFVKTISRFIGRIEQAPPPPTWQSGMAAFETPPTYYQGRKTAFFSLEWCASCIAHDAYHSKLYHEYKQQHGLPVPDKVWSGPAIEIVCNKFQIEVGQVIGLPEADLDRLAMLDGSHALMETIDW